MPIVPMPILRATPVLISAFALVACGSEDPDSPASDSNVVVEMNGTEAAPNDDSGSESPVAGAEVANEEEPSTPAEGSDGESASPDLDLAEGESGPESDGGEGEVGETDSAMASDGAAMVEEEAMAGGAEEQDTEAPVIEATAIAELTATTAAPNDWQGFAGTATWTQVEDEVTVVVEVTGCPDGPHISHIHANPNCGPDGEAAGLHWVLNGEVFSDMICSGGVGSFTHAESTDVWTIGGDASTDVTRHAYMIHALSDAQGAGARAACGSIAQPQ